MDMFDILHDAGFAGNSYNKSIGNHDMDMFQNNAQDSVRTSFNQNGEFVIKTSNMSHGHETFVNGKHVTHTENNALGGQNIYYGSHLAQITVPNVEGGIDIYNGNMQSVGAFIPDGIGGENYLSFSGNANSIMQLNDPLAHSVDYKMEPFNVKAYK